jgi:hypothetical protein
MFLAPFVVAWIVNIRQKVCALPATVWLFTIGKRLNLAKNSQHRSPYLTACTVIWYSRVVRTKRHSEIGNSGYVYSPPSSLLSYK